MLKSIMLCPVICVFTYVMELPPSRLHDLFHLNMGDSYYRLLFHEHQF